MTCQSLIEFASSGELGRGPRQDSIMEIQLFSSLVDVQVTLTKLDGPISVSRHLVTDDVHG